MTLDELTGVVQYRTWDGQTADALIHTRVLYSRPEDRTYPHPYRGALNTRGATLSFTQAAIDRGDVWPHPADSAALASAIAARYRIATGEDHA